MRHFLADSLTISLVQLLDLVNQSRCLGNKSTFDENGSDFLELMLASEVLNIFDQCFFWDAYERVANPVAVVSERRDTQRCKM